MTDQLSLGLSGAADDEPRLNRLEVLDRWRYLAKVALWPPARQADPERWLDNFQTDEQEVALALLNALMYFNDELTDRLLTTSIRLIATRISSPGASYAHRKAQWLEFLMSAKFTHLVSPDDQDDETKSGYMFARKTRQILGSPDQVRPASDVASEILAGSGAPIVVVDDFAGTGSKFIEGWNRNYELKDGTTMSYAQLAKDGATIFFCPALCTDTARTEIERLPNPPLLSVANVLSSEMSVVGPQSQVMPAYLHGEIPDVVRAASERSGSEDPAFGWGELGLALSFAHNTPDTTLPIFYCENEGWYPIVRRR